jgi:serine/threonine-protein kinase
MAEQTATAEQIAQRVFDLDLVDDRQLQEVWSALGTRDVPGEEFAQMLVRRGLLTNYQLERMLKGERSGFFYGPYKVLYRVATGSFARVYRAVDPRSNKVVALKVLRRRFSEEPAQTDQFLREGEMGKALRHPNIVPIHEVHSVGGNHFLVLDFIEGRNLRDFVKIRGKLSPVEATQLCQDLASGLGYAHQRGVCHRDLKMTNVLVTSRGQAKLVDFGLAAADDRIDDDALANHANPRTIDYAGLERATGVRKDDGRSDVYFLGCMYYNMLTGEPPLQETKDRIQRLSKSRYLDVVPILRADPSIPKVAAAVVNRAMELDPSKRYQNATEMLLDLKIAAEKLAAGTDIEELPDAEGGALADAEPDRARWQAMLIPENERRAIMFVESNTSRQDIFRAGLKKLGYRVLLTSDPQRALARFEDDPNTADCIVLSTGNIGKPALEAFWAFVTGEKTAQVPAVLLLGEKHSWQPPRPLPSHQRIATMPLKLRQLRRLLSELVPQNGAGSALDSEAEGDADE